MCKETRVDRVWKQVALSKVSARDAFAVYLNHYVRTVIRCGRQSPETLEALLNLEALVEPWLERAS